MLVDTAHGCLRRSYCYLQAASVLVQVRLPVAAALRLPLVAAAPHD